MVIDASFSEESERPVHGVAGAFFVRFFVFA